MNKRRKEVAKKLSSDEKGHKDKEPEKKEGNNDEVRKQERL